MVCAHQVGHQLYGAERSLLDVLDSLNQLEVNLLVTLPGALNREYVEQVRDRAWRLAIVPYGWWRAGQAPVSATLGHFEALLQRYSVDALYANTLVLDEPLMAAQRLGIPRLVHVRELPDYDPALCEILGATPNAVRERVGATADVPLTNSAFTAQALGLNDAIVVPNCIDVARFEGIAAPLDRGEAVTLGMISSNIPKKGLDDFVALARVLESAAPKVRCCLIGSDNSYIQALRKQQARGSAPGNLVFAGYADTPRHALALVDILVNLSHFQESFGRTVLEAMAAGRPVIAYDWGALPELIVHGETGYLVPLGDVQAVADAVVNLTANPGVSRRLGESGQRRATDYYGADMMRTALAAALQKINKH
jgi:glycosyltransferase involved in cell wall biosynthesis